MKSNFVTASDPRLVARLTAANLPTSDLSDDGQSFFIFENDGREIGSGGFMLADSDALLRSIVIDDDARGQRLGSAALEALIGEAQSRGARRAWLLTTDAEGFFVRNGFAGVARDTAPEAIRSTPQFSGICPGSAAFMSREIA